MNPSGPAIKPADVESATDSLERAYARHTANAVAPWLPVAFNADAADSAAVAAEGVGWVDNLTSSYQTKMYKNHSR